MVGTLSFEVRILGLVKKTNRYVRANLAIFCHCTCVAIDLPANGEEGQRAVFGRDSRWSALARVTHQFHLRQRWLVVYAVLRWGIEK